MSIGSNLSFYVYFLLKSCEYKNIIIFFSISLFFVGLAFLKTIGILSREKEHKLCMFGLKKAFKTKKKVDIKLVDL